MEAAHPACLQTTAPAPKQHSISTLPVSKPLSQPAETPMDTSAILTDALTEPLLASDPSLALQSTPFQATLNSDPLLSAPSPQPLQQHMSDSYTPSSGYVSYMETLLHSHFPQDNNRSPLY